MEGISSSSSSSIVTNTVEEYRQAVLDDGEEDFVSHLPPGYRFHPTDNEIVNYYLTEKIMNPSFIARAIAEVDLNKCEPWDLPEKAKMGEKEWYFFCQRDRKYPTGMRTNRATEAGYWKATGKDREVGMKNNNNNLGHLGMKKTLVFYQGRAPKGAKTNWVMHEYRLDAKLSHQFSSPHNHSPNKHEEWVVCRVFYKRTLITKSSNQEEDDHKVNFNHLMVDFPALQPLPNSAKDSMNYYDTLNGSNLFSNPGFPCINPPPPPSMMYQLPFTPDPLFIDTHDSSGLTMRLSQLTELRSNSSYTNDITFKKESTQLYNGVTYNDDPSIVGGTISDSEFDNLWNSPRY